MEIVYKVGPTASIVAAIAWLILDYYRETSLEDVPTWFMAGVLACLFGGGLISVACLLIIIWS